MYASFSTDPSMDKLLTLQENVMLFFSCCFGCLK